MPTVREVAQRLRAGELDVDAAVTELSGVAATTTVVHGGTADERLTRDANDPEVPEDDDVIHLETLRGLGTITTAEFDRLVDVLS